MSTKPTVCRHWLRSTCRHRFERQHRRRCNDATTSSTTTLISNILQQKDLKMKLNLILALVVIIFQFAGCQEFESGDEDESLLPPLISLSPSLRPTPPSSPSSSCIYDGVVCPLTVDNVIDIDSSSVAETPSTCQYMCFREQLCQNFTFFQNSAGETRFGKFVIPWGQHRTVYITHLLPDPAAPSWNHGSRGRFFR